MPNTLNSLQQAFQNLNLALCSSQTLHEVGVRGAARLPGLAGVVPAGASNHSEPLRKLETAVGDAVTRDSNQTRALGEVRDLLTQISSAEKIDSLVVKAGCGGPDKLKEGLGAKMMLESLISKFLPVIDGLNKLL